MRSLLTAAFLAGVLAGQEAYLGLTVAPNAAGLEELGRHEGVRVTAVAANSPAAAAGLRPGDVILRLAGQRYDWPEAFYAAVARLAVGRAVPVEVLRGGAAWRTTVVPAPRRRPRPPRKLLYLTDRRRAGVKVRALRRAEARALGLPPNEGLRVVGFWDGSPWARDGLRAGDVLHRLNGRPLHDPRELLRRLARLRPGTPVRLEVLRDGRRRRLRTVVTQRARRLESFCLPPLFRYRAPRPEEGSWSVLFGLLGVSWRKGRRTVRLLYLLTWTTGEAPVLEEVPVPPETGP